MPLKLQNTLSRSKQEFSPIRGNQARVYICGVTAYGPLHLGHVRTQVAYDTMLEYLRTYKKMDVLHVQNITDVGHIVADTDEGEDKIVKAARERGVHPMALVDVYIQDMWAGYDALKCRRPDISPRATGHIVEIIDWCQTLVEMGLAYESDGDVYFDVEKAVDYGKLSGNRLRTLLDGVRIDNRSGKRNPFDFALWKKAAPNHVMQWTSPWGKGYPGWHIECSVMSEKYLGAPFDLHGGARELAFPHHENEIAQSEGYLGHPAVRFWVHTGVLTINGEKMAKSKGNFVTVQDALAKYSASLLRWFILSNHYASSVDLSDANLLAARSSLERVNNFLFNVNNAKPSDAQSPDLGTLLRGFEADFESEMDDDLNTPRALAEIFGFVNKANPYAVEGKMDKQTQQGIIEAFGRIDKVFKCFDVRSSPAHANGAGDNAIEALIQQRGKAKSARDWKTADQIREQLKALGIEVMDRKDGSAVWKRIEAS